MQHETMFSIPVEELKVLFEAGYLVLRPPLSVKHISDITRKIFDIFTNGSITNSAGNIGKLILLRHPKLNKQIEILTDNDFLVALAVDRFNFQMEPIGTIIRAKCMALHPSQQIYLEQLIGGLDGYSGWQIKLGDRNDNFEVTSRILFTEQQDIQTEIERIRLLMDALCLITKVGFYIRHISLASQPRMHPAVSFGEEETMLRPVKKEDISEAEARIQLSSEMALILRGINQAYVDNCYPSRLDRLWATVETVFCERPNHLLSRDEIEAITAQVKGIPSLDKDRERLDKLIELLKNPDRLPKEGRNERIANKISKSLNRDYETTYEEIRKCSQLRGQHGHAVSNNWQSINEAENYLRQVLIEYLGLLRF